MKQTKIESLIEAVTNTGVAFLISLLTGWLIFPLYYPDSTFGDSFQIVMIFTAVSVARGYVVRRWFNRKQITPRRFARCLHGCEWDNCPECGKE